MNPNVIWPAASTVGQILSRPTHQPEKKKRRATPSSQPSRWSRRPTNLVYGF